MRKYESSYAVDAGGAGNDVINDKGTIVRIKTYDNRRFPRDRNSGLQGKE